MKLSIITPEKVFFSGEAAQVTAPGTEGDFGVLPGHAPFITTLRPGVIEVMEEGGQSFRIAVIEGLAEVTPEHCTILAETARTLDNAHLHDVRTELRAAEEALAAALDDVQKVAAEKKRLMAQTMVDAL